MSESIGQREAIDRRRFLKGAATVAWAAPVIATLSASPAYAACVPLDGNCGPLDPVTNACPAGNCCTGLNCKKPRTRNICECKTSK